jgi:hypothetical protein
MYISHVELEDLKRESGIEQFNCEKEILSLLNVIGMELDTIVEIPGTLSPKIKNFDLDSNC